MSAIFATPPSFDRESHTSHLSKAFDTRPSPTATRIATISTGLIVSAKGKLTLDEKWPKPQILSRNEVCIRVETAGLNPLDWKSVRYNFNLPAFPWTIGREVAGVVESIGLGVTNVAIGDRVWSSTYYRDVRAGTLQTHCVLPCHTVGVLPDNLSYEEGASLGVPALTAAMTLWKWLKLPLPSVSLESRSIASKGNPESDYLLIWGGASSTGQFFTQLAALSAQSGLQTITVTSSASASLSKSLGAHHIIARDGLSNQEISSRVHEISKGRLRHAIDLVGAETSQACFNLLGKSDYAGQRMLCPIAAPGFKPLAVGPRHGLVTVHDIEMKRFVLDPSNRIYMDILNQLGAANWLRFPEREIVVGLERVEEALNKMSLGQGGGKKWVVRIA
ncbi:hypothetical protein P7C73_g1800, partial [Tremellales sp. Uapishka_1]